MSVEDIWKDDLLNRGADANFLIDYLIAKAEVAKSNERGVALNLDSSWGSGKTFFLNRLGKQLSAKGLKVANVDAWRDDHADDPLFAVMSALIGALELDSKAVRLIDALKENAGKIALRTGKGLLTRGVGLIVGMENVEGIADDLAKAVAGAVETGAGEYADKAIGSFEKGQTAIADFRKILADAVGKLQQQPLFVLVDELDRCRPTYAVQLLERIKHLFDVPNVVFVVATDTGQLEHTIRAIYGSDFDSSKYLHRFFDRTYEFGDPSIGQFIEILWGTYKFSDERFSSMRDCSHIEILKGISLETGLSLRDIEQCFDILWTVERSFTSKLPVLLPYVFTMIVAFHKRCGFSVDSNWHSKVFSGPIAQFKLHSRDWGERQTTTRAYTAQDVFNECHNQIIVRGVFDRNGDRPSDPLGQFVSDYRSAEHQRLHGGVVRGERTASELEGLRTIIASAGKVSV